MSVKRLTDEERAERALARAITKTHAFYRDFFYGSDEWKAQRAAVFARDRGRCQTCGSEAVIASHIIPPRRGGLPVMANLISSCRVCWQVSYHASVSSVSERRAYIMHTLAGEHACRFCTR